jgi:hypothetical protein
MVATRCKAPYVYVVKSWEVDVAAARDVLDAKYGRLSVLRRPTLLYVQSLTA